MHPLITALQTQIQRNNAPFHTPGHKLGRQIPAALGQLLGDRPFQADFPDLPGLDLFDPEGVVAEAQTLAAQLFGAEQTWFLVNGSSVGVMAAIAATTAPGAAILVPRNLHRSAIAGLLVSGARPVFVLPEYDAERDLVHPPTPEAIAVTLDQHPGIQAVLVVSPSYHGVCADLRAIAAIAHRHGIPLLVDAAHGAHLGFHPQLPASPLSQGADLVVQSTHKTLSALTQAAMLHVQGPRIDRDRLGHTLQWLQTSSPSNLLLASLDGARSLLAEEGTALLGGAIDLANMGRSHLAALPGLTLLEAQDVPTGMGLDPTRLTLLWPGWDWDGFWLDEQLQARGVTAELPGLRHLTLIVSLATQHRDVDRLGAAMTALTHDAASAGVDPTPELVPPPVLPDLVCTPREAWFAPRQRVPWAAAVGQVSAELICPYPPGIPLLVPGERVSPEAIALLQRVQSLGGYVSGNADPTGETLAILKAIAT